MVAMSTIIMSNDKISKNYRLQGYLIKNTLFNVFKRLIIKLASTIEKQKARKQLGKLDDHLLRDIGMSRLEAKKESQKYFWQK